MARKATGSKSSRSNAKTKSTRSRSKSATRRTSRRATARPKAEGAGVSVRRASKAGASAAGGKGGKGDFGLRTGTENQRKAAMLASAEAKNRPAGDRRTDPRQPRSGVGSRQAGVGKRDAGPGSDSGGDIDADIVGVGDGAALAQSGPDDEATIGAAETSGGSEEFASGPPARGDKRGAADEMSGDFVDHGGGDEAIQAGR